MCESAPNHPGHDPDHPGQNLHHPNSLGHIGWGVLGGGPLTSFFSTMRYYHIIFLHL